MSELGLGIATMDPIVCYQLPPFIILRLVSQILNRHKKHGETDSIRILTCEVIRYATYLTLQVISNNCSKGLCLMQLNKLRVAGNML